jgi:hypothetical protein
MGAAGSSGETLDTDFVSLLQSYCKPLVERWDVAEYVRAGEFK